MASAEYEKKYGKERNVEVHHRKGCSLCGKRTKHYHTQSDWREHVDKAGSLR